MCFGDKVSGHQVYNYHVQSDQVCDDEKSWYHRVVAILKDWLPKW